MVNLHCNSGDETYNNQMKYGKEVFEELNELQQNGFDFEGIHHDIKIVSCCDWKAGACIEGGNTQQILIAFSKSISN